jgi:hypothetical protein
MHSSLLTSALDSIYFCSLVLPVAPFEFLSEFIVYFWSEILISSAHSQAILMYLNCYELMLQIIVLPFLCLLIGRRVNVTNATFIIKTMSLWLTRSKDPD